MGLKKLANPLLYELRYPRVAELIQDPLSCLILSESSSITYVISFVCCVNMHQLAGLAACWRTTHHGAVNLLVGRKQARPSAAYSQATKINLSLHYVSSSAGASAERSTSFFFIFI